MDKGPGRLRLDLYLKRTGLVKRRTLAATLCENEYVHLNGRSAGPGKTVKIGDRVEIRYARKKVLVEVTGIPVKQLRKGEGYRILHEEQVIDDLF